MDIFIIFGFFLPDGLIIRVVSKNRPGYYWSIDEGIEGYLMQEAELFKVINPGLYGEGSVSFESVTRPGKLNDIFYYYILPMLSNLCLASWVHVLNSNFK